MGELKTPEMEGHPGYAGYLNFEVAALPEVLKASGYHTYMAGNWKILWMPKPFGTGEWELFNLEQDPAEIDDLSKQHPDKLKEMVARWQQYKKDNGVLDISFDLSDKVK